jgi:exonuclease SbcC
MIPLKLELTNFLSYRDTAVLDFDHIHLACIAGANGAGKSSILDAITWVLFGKARSKSDDDLVNRLSALGDGAAAVRFTFRLEESVYRVQRRKPAGKSAQLELQILAQGEQWKTLTESKIRETQMAIETLLRMNYDTFINASFLLQGKADEFTTKTPNKRKEILADLLGLGVWDIYRDAATEQRKGEENRLMVLDAQIGEIDTELAEEEARWLALQAAQDVHTAVADRLADKEALFAEMQRAATAVQQQQEQVRTLGTNLARAQQRLVGMEKAQAQRQTERDSYAAILAREAEIAAAYAAWQQADAALRDWQTKADAYHQLQARKRPYELAIAQETSRLQQQLHALQTQASQATAAAAEQQTLADRLAQLAQTAAEQGAQLAELAAQEAAWQEARTVLVRLEEAHKATQREQQQLAQRAQQVEKLTQEQTAVQQNQQQASAELVRLAAQLAALAQTNDQYLSSLAERDGLQARQPQLRERMDRHKKRIDQLQAEAGGACPLCGQPLTEAHRQTVLVELQEEGGQMGVEFRTNKERIAYLETAVTQAEAELKQRPKLEQAQQTQQQRLATAEARLAEIAQAVAEWQQEGAVRLAALDTAVADTSALTVQQQQVAQLQTAVAEKAALEKSRQLTQQQIAQASARQAECARLVAEWQTSGLTTLAEVQQRLDDDAIDPPAQVALAELEVAQTAVGYDAVAHEAAQQGVQALAAAPADQQQWQTAVAAVKPLDDALADGAQQLVEQQTQVAELQQQQESAAAALQTLMANQGDVRALEAELFRLREEAVQANRQVGVAQNRLAVLDDQRVRRVALSAERTACTQQIQRLRLLEKACSKQGVPALLIEQALPEIEDRANELLERLTGGEMRVHFDTQRQLKSRDGLAETLDIRIQDGAGERPYDNFSGGEQFRVNFAIRLALSQLLARRAGARLQTLVVDEGFGSQDPNGRQRLIEAINTIQNDFAVILVITHIDELRDAFPARVDVEKRPFGSTISVTA